MDAREKWMKQAISFAQELSDRGYRNEAGRNLEAHLRTTPEGFALVPVEPTEAMITSIVGETIGYGGGEFAPEIKRYEAIHLIKEIIKAAVPPKSEPL